VTARKPCPEAPGPLEAYARRFDECFESLAQRRAFRDYLAGLLLPRDRNKTLTGLAGTEPVLGAQHPEAQRLQYFLSEAAWDAAALNDRRVAALAADPATAPHDQGVLVVDDTGDRKDGTKTAHVARQYLGSLGKVDNGIVAVTSLWADERVYSPLHAVPYTPAARLPQGRRDPAFRTKPQLARALVAQALAAGVRFRAVVADCFYGDNLDFELALGQARQPYVLALKPRKGAWVREGEAETPEDAARRVPWTGPDQPGARSGGWTRVVRPYRDGHAEVWWAAEARFAGYGPDGVVRLVVATTDPAALPPLTTWYLATNLPRPGGPRVTTAPFAPAELAEVVRLYGLRNWVEQGYKQVKDELGWADFQVRTDRAIRRHWTLVHCAFSFCWRAWFAARERAWPPPPLAIDLPPEAPAPRPPPAPAAPTPARDARPAPVGVGGKEERAAAGPATTPVAAPPDATALARVAGGPAPRAELAGALDGALAHLAGLVNGVPAPRPPGAARPRRRRLQPAPVSPLLTKYR
jgi:SRSO17 transposase